MDIGAAFGGGSAGAAVHRKRRQGKASPCRKSSSEATAIRRMFIWITTATQSASTWISPRKRLGAWGIRRFLRPSTGSRRIICWKAAKSTASGAAFPWRVGSSVSMGGTLYAQPSGDCRNANSGIYTWEDLAGKTVAVQSNRKAGRSFF